jgi:hypothetical protein
MTMKRMPAHLPIWSFCAPCAVLGIEVITWMAWMRADSS